MVFGPRGQPVLAKLNPDRREARGLEIHAELGGFKSEVQHLQACKVRRCKTRPDSTSNFSLKNA
jgi:hypothetical protein